MLRFLTAFLIKTQHESRNFRKTQNKSYSTQFKVSEYKSVLQTPFFYLFQFGKTSALMKNVSQQMFL